MIFTFINAIIPNKNRNIVKKYENYLHSKAIYVPICDYIHCYKNCCHENVINLVKEYGGNIIKGYYLITEADSSNSAAIYHSIWEYNNQYIDPTPFEEGILFHTFIRSDIINEKFLCL